MQAAFGQQDFILIFQTKRSMEKSSLHFIWNGAYGRLRWVCFKYQNKACALPNYISSAIERHTLLFRQYYLAAEAEDAAAAEAAGAAGAEAADAAEEDLLAASPKSGSPFLCTIMRPDISMCNAWQNHWQ